MKTNLLLAVFMSLVVMFCAGVVRAEETATSTAPIVEVAAPVKKVDVSSSGQFIWKTNPQMWIKIQIEFIQDKIERLQAQLKAMLAQ